MRPGQRTPNEFELAILEGISAGIPALRPFLGRLAVLSREFTGVGSYTKFLADPSMSHPDLGDRDLGLDALIVVPGVPYGMGACLMCRAGLPDILETFTSGSDAWDGTFEGFSLR
jgi:hypothetical protein